MILIAVTLSTWFSSMFAPRSTGSLSQTILRKIKHRVGNEVRGLSVELYDSEQHLITEPNTSPNRVAEVVLSGRTSTYYVKQLATHASLDYTGGMELTNEIEVGW